MGLGSIFLDDLIELRRSGGLNGARHVAEIGDQQLADSLMESPNLPLAYELFGCTKPPSLRPVGVANFTDQAPSSAAFWKALGFERVAIDLCGNSVHLDLNKDRVPWRLRRRFDLVVNAGTTEHVANQANAFAIIHDLCRVGGLMYHELPAGGAIDHGLISYEPKFFVCLCKANGYEIIFLRYWTHGRTQIPDYLQSSRTQDAISECALRVALRKRRDHAFAVPMDAR